MEVQFVINKSGSKGAKAEKVTLIGGEKVSCKRYDREVNKETSYTGTVMFFGGHGGFGFIIPDREIEFMGLTIKTDAEADEGLYVAREDIIFSENSSPNLTCGTKVRFLVYKNEKGRLGACEVRNVDGTAYEYKKVKKRKKSSKKGGANKKRRK